MDESIDRAPFVVDINRANAADLRALPGVGRILAKRIVDERAHGPFRELSDLTRVPGIRARHLAVFAARASFDLPPTLAPPPRNSMITQDEIVAPSAPPPEVRDRRSAYDQPPAQERALSTEAAPDEAAVVASPPAFVESFEEMLPPSQSVARSFDGAASFDELSPDDARALLDELAAAGATLSFDDYDAAPAPSVSASLAPPGRDEWPAYEEPAEAAEAAPVARDSEVDRPTSLHPPVAPLVDDDDSALLGGALGILSDDAPQDERPLIGEEALAQDLTALGRFSHAGSVPPEERGLVTTERASMVPSVVPPRVSRLSIPGWEVQDNELLATSIPVSAQPAAEERTSAPGKGRPHRRRGWIVMGASLASAASLGVLAAFASMPRQAHGASAPAASAALPREESQRIERLETSTHGATQAVAHLEDRVDAQEKVVVALQQDRKHLAEEVAAVRETVKKTNRETSARIYQLNEAVRVLDVYFPIKDRKAEAPVMGPPAPTTVLVVGAPAPHAVGAPKAVPPKAVGPSTHH